MFLRLCCNFSSSRFQPLRRFTAAKCCCVGVAAKVLPSSPDHIYCLAGGSRTLKFGASLIPVANLPDEWLWSVWYTVTLHMRDLPLRVLGQTRAANIHAKRFIVWSRGSISNDLSQRHLGTRSQKQKCAFERCSWLYSGKQVVCEG